MSKKVCKKYENKLGKIYMQERPSKVTGALSYRKVRKRNKPLMLTLNDGLKINSKELFWMFKEIRNYVMNVQDLFTKISRQKNNFRNKRSERRSDRNSVYKYANKPVEFKIVIERPTSQQSASGD
ncbi:hypothetical protein BH10BAC5_BH10BAC5_21060 [soil metagenome]